MIQNAAARLVFNEHMSHLSLSPCTGSQLQLASSSRHWCLHIEQPQAQHPPTSTHYYESTSPPEAPPTSTHYYESTSPPEAPPTSTHYYESTSPPETPPTSTHYYESTSPPEAPPTSTHYYESTSPPEAPPTSTHYYESTFPPEAPPTSTHYYESTCPPEAPPTSTHSTITEVPSQRGSKSLSRTFSFTIPGCWNDLPPPPPHPDCWILVNLQATTENSSLSTLLDFIQKKKKKIVSFSPSLTSLYIFEQCLRLGVTSTSSVCLPLQDESLYVFPNCKSLWIKASAKWLNVNVAHWQCSCIW